jgi:hypothetical protein
MSCWCQAATEEVYPESFVVIDSCISMPRSNFTRKMVDYKSIEKSVGHTLLQKALHLVHLVEERLQSSVSL